MNEYFVYIMGSVSGTLYVGVTNDLRKRVYQHKHKLLPGFTNQYEINRLVYYELYSDVRDAIVREKQIKGWLRNKKVGLIKTLNPTWQDLSKDWFE